MDIPDHSTLEVAGLLLAHGADPNAGYLWDGVYPFTALTGAFGGGEVGDGNLPPHRHATELARLLLGAGADPNDLQALYNRGLGSGGGGRDIGHIRLLLAYGLGRGDGGPWRARGGPGFPTPAQLLQDELLRAARDGLPELARLLIEHGVDVDGRGWHPVFGRHTAYELAALNGNREVAELLAAAGAAVTTLDPLREFVAACLAADRTAVARLLAAEPGLAAEAIRREPHLIVRAAERGRTEAVRLLAALGFDVNALGRTAGPLHHAAWNGDLATVEALVELGADPTLRDREHDATPLGWAEYNHQHEVAAFLGGGSGDQLSSRFRTG